jgi:transposase
VVDRLRQRFAVRRVCIIADRGMISAETIAELEARGLLYILGVRERADTLARELVLDDPAPFIPLTLAKRNKEIEYEAKAVVLAGRRYIVCRNRDEMKKDAAARTAILAALERRLKKGDKSLIGNKGYRRFLATPGDDHFAIDQAKAEEDAKFDGVFVLRTNADLSPLEAMLCYKQLWRVERAFRTSKGLFATRPIFHKLDETIRGHVSCSFLAPRAEKGAGGPHRRHRQTGRRRRRRSQRFLARYSRRPRLVDRNRGRTGRQAFHPALGPAPWRQPRATRRRRRPAAHRAPTR